MTHPGCIQQHNNHSHSCKTFTTLWWPAPWAVIQQFCDFQHSAVSQLLAIKVRRAVRRQHCFPLCFGDCCTCHTTVLKQCRIPCQNTKCIHAMQTRDCCCLHCRISNSVSFPWFLQWNRLILLQIRNQLLLAVHGDTRMFHTTAGSQASEGACWLTDAPTACAFCQWQALCWAVIMPRSMTWIGQLSHVSVKQMSQTAFPFKAWGQNASPKHACCPWVALCIRTDPKQNSFLCKSSQCHLPQLWTPQQQKNDIFSFNWKFDNNIHV